MPSKGLPVEVAGPVTVSLLLRPILFYTESGVRDRVLVLLRQVELELLFKTHAHDLLLKHVLVRELTVFLITFDSF